MSADQPTWCERRYGTPCYSLNAAARRLRVSPERVVELHRTGELIGHYDGNGQAILRIAAGALADYERRQRAAAAEQP